MSDRETASIPHHLVESLVNLDGKHASKERPLVVDLDGTLIDTDMLHESVLSLFSNHPGKVLNLPIWLIQGRAVLKRRIAQHADIDFDTLPLNQALVAFLRTEKAKGGNSFLRRRVTLTWQHRLLNDWGCSNGFSLPRGASTSRVTQKPNA